MAKGRKGSGGFSSTLRENEPYIHDKNYREHMPEVIDIPGGQRQRGYIPRDWSKEPFGSLPYAAKFDLPLIPESEWTERIEQMEKDKSRLSDIMEQAGIESLDQDGTNYCWTNGVVTAILAVRARMNEPYVKLSPASVAAPVKGYRNQGGWGGEALEYIIEHGIVKADLWPPNAIKKQYDTPETQEDRAQRKVTEWWELPGKNFNALMTCVLLRIPVGIGLNWWSHEVCAIDGVVVKPGQYGIRIRNSWGAKYGSNGFAVLNRSKATPDDAVAPRVVMASE